MEESLRVLHIEDSDDDALLILRTLKRGGFNVAATRVATAEAFQSALTRRPWDVIIADYQLPRFGAPEALRIVQHHGNDVPFIVVSGTIGEQRAVELMRAGAHDYVMKDRLERLSEAVRREIREAASRRERQRIERALQALISGTAAVTGVDFFAALVQNVAQSLSADTVVVSEVIDNRLHTLACWSNQQLQPSISYVIAGTPCEQTLQQGVFIQPTGLHQAFQLPEHPLWIHAVSYLGIALYDLNRRPFGNLCILDITPIETPKHASEMLHLFAARAAAELERQRAIHSLELLNRDLEQIVADRTAELREANEKLVTVNVELARTTRAKDQFLASMSHELRTPLHAILGMSESLQEGIYGNLQDRQLQAVSTIDQSGRHLLDLINDILDLAKIASGKLEITPVGVYLSLLCENSLIFVREQAIRKRIQLSHAISPELLDQQVLLDELRIRQALINLLANAVTYTPDGGRVHVAVELHKAADQPAILMHVIDNGIGIAQEDLSRIFEPFEQINHHSRKQHGGTGLGLALVRQIVELHGGNIQVQSQPGAGSRFTMTLPYGEA